MNNKNAIVILDKIRVFLHRFEDSILIGLVILMIGMAVTQILLRNLFDSGIVWGDTMIRISVLWIGLFGAMVASRKGDHISIDIIARYLPKRAGEMVNGLVELFTALICSAASYYSIYFVASEYEYGGKAFSVIPVWMCEAIIPFALLIIALRYFILSFINFSKVKLIFDNSG